MGRETDHHHMRSRSIASVYISRHDDEQAFDGTSSPCRGVCTWAHEFLAWEAEPGSTVFRQGGHLQTLSSLLGLRTKSVAGRWGTKSEGCTTGVVVGALRLAAGVSMAAQDISTAIILVSDCLHRGAPVAALPQYYGMFCVASQGAGGSAAALNLARRHGCCG